MKSQIIAIPLSVALPEPRWTRHERWTRRNGAGGGAHRRRPRGDRQNSGGPQSVILAGDKVLGRGQGHATARPPPELGKELFSLTSPRPGGNGGWDGMPAPLPRNDRRKSWRRSAASTSHCRTSRARRPDRPCIPAYWAAPGPRCPPTRPAVTCNKDAPLGGRTRRGYAGFVANGYRR